MDSEFEFKLEIPARSMKAVQAAMSRGRGKTQVLQATYYDTPANDLRCNGLVLRVRREGDAWVQTLKADSGRPLERLEHEAPIPAPRFGTPLPRAELHAGTDVGRRLFDALARLTDPPEWRALFLTEVQRTTRMASEGSSRIEIALDRGRIASQDDEIALREIEFELKQGSAADAASLAQRWLESHGLWLSAITKFEKGLRLAAGMDSPAAATAKHPVFRRDSSLGEVALAALGASLDQVLRNASEIASGNSGAGHIHQLRVGIRRARTVLRELLPPGAGAGIEPALVDAFRKLGQHRDAEHVLEQARAMVSGAGGPAVLHEESVDMPSPAAIVRAGEFQRALLSLVALAHSPAIAANSGDARTHVAARLRKLSRHVVAEGVVFAQLDAQRQHRVRKRLKRLRYLAEFAAPLFPQGKAAAYLDQLKPVQDALGLYNDELVALEWYRARTPHDARAWFGAGWFSSRRETQSAQCAAVLREFAEAKPFWKKH